MRRSAGINIAAALLLLVGTVGFGPCEHCYGRPKGPRCHGSGDRHHRDAPPWPASHCACAVHQLCGVIHAPEPLATRAVSSMSDPAPMVAVLPVALSEVWDPLARPVARASPPTRGAPPLYLAHRSLLI